MTTIHTPDDQTVIDATRIWLEKAVIGLNLCPFAKAVYVKNQIRYVVSHARHTDQFLEELDSELERLANTDPEEIDTTLLIHPTLFPEFSVFNDLLDLAETAPEALGLEGVLQVASFHPDFQFADTQPDDMSNYTNRSPYPTAAKIATPHNPAIIYKPGDGVVSSGLAYVAVRACQAVVC